MYNKLKVVYISDQNSQRCSDQPERVYEFNANSIVTINAQRRNIERTWAYACRSTLNRMKIHTASI